MAEDGIMIRTPSPRRQCDRRPPNPVKQRAYSGTTLRVKRWVERALGHIAPYLRELSDPDKEVLFAAIRNNVDRIDFWESKGTFSSLNRLRAKIQDWRARGIGTCRSNPDAP